MAKLTPEEIAQSRRAVERWEAEGGAIKRTFEFEDFRGAMHFVNEVAKHAEEAGHHPDIDIRWNRVTLALTTHDEGGLTAKDFALAARFDRLMA